MDLLKKFSDKALAATRRCEEYESKQRMALAREVREKVLLPFCKKHNLEMDICIWGNYFYLPNGDKISDYELAKHIDDPLAEDIEDYLSIEYMGDHLFDYFMEMNITKDHLKA